VSQLIEQGGVERTHTNLRATLKDIMKKSLRLIALSAVFAGSVFAQTAAPGAPAKAPAAVAAPATAAATVNAVCKDGTPFSGDTLKGACRGHGGVDKKADTKSTAAPPVAGKTAAKSDSAPMAQAAGGGADKVWANDSSKVYHCPGDKYYGKTKKGEYMTEADAKSKGFHADHAKVCTK
jgi:hypothetical protein